MSQTDLFGKLAGSAAGPTLAGKCARQVFQTLRGFVAKLADDLRHRLTEGVAAVRTTIHLSLIFSAGCGPGRGTGAGDWPGGSRPREKVTSWRRMKQFTLSPICVS